MRKHGPVEGVWIKSLIYVHLDSHANYQDSNTTGTKWNADITEVIEVILYTCAFLDITISSNPMDVQSNRSWQQTA